MMGFFRKYLIAITIVLIACALPAFCGGRTEVVGKGIKPADITEFWYTYSSSVNPPEFRRYRFYIDDGVWHFYHERREGNHWPLSESDITVSGDIVLPEDHLEELFRCLEGGSVRARGSSAESGNSGPWLYLFWKGDKSKYQEYSFGSYSDRLSLEVLCISLEAHI
ncbi:MAG: hypothetical protein K6E89_01360 [Sphaerochaetaceae bacterium]|nr:hypothetical protein [Sphaerochaetaceae bacterium]